jgi:REP element-mobilizing transposase RayT
MPQSLTQMCVHIIFSTKDRRPFLKNKDIRKRLYDYIDAICREKNCNSLIVNGVEDEKYLWN